MDEVIEKDNIKIKNMIYEMRGKQVMLDIEIFATNYHYYLYCEMITHYDIGGLISVLFKYVPIKFGKEINI